MSSTDTSIIDNKKNKKSIQVFDITNIKKYIFSYMLSMLISIIILLIIICSGTTILYSCKVAQSNILPTDLLCNPYNDTPLTIIPEVKNININVTNINGSKISEKITFLYEQNNGNIIIDTLQKIKQNPKLNSKLMYFITILENLLCFNYNSLNVYFNFLNKRFSESLIILGGPVLSILYFIFIYLLSWGYLIILFFTKMFWIFTKNENNSNTNNQPNPDIKHLSFFNPLSILIVIILLCFFISSITIVFPILAFVSLIYCFLSIITMTSTKGSDGTNYNYINALTDVFYYKKSLISYITSFIVIANAFISFGSLGGFISLIIVLLIYFKIIKIPLFSNTGKEVYDNFNELSDYEMAIKSCNNVNLEQPSQQVSFSDKNIIIPESNVKESNVLLSTDVEPNIPESNVKESNVLLSTDIEPNIPESNVDNNIEDTVKTINENENKKTGGNKKRNKKV
jgi:hypothetical protein